MENCYDVQGFMMNHAVGGGNRSGVGSLILKSILLITGKM